MEAGPPIGVRNAKMPDGMQVLPHRALALTQERFSQLRDDPLCAEKSRPLVH